MFRWSLVVARVWGIPIRIHFTLLLLLGLILFSGWRASGAVGMVLAFLVTLSVMTGIALHELGHSLVGLWKGCRIREITLTPLGGVAQMENVPHRPRDEFLMAVAGPAVSVALGVASWGLGAYLPLPQGLWPVPFFESYAVRGNFAHFFALLNFGWAVFNLIPAFPMDGGRVFRALLTPKFGRLRATRLAARLGQFIAVLFGFWAFWQKPTDWILVAIAFFIYIAAGTEYRMVQLQEAFRRSGLASVFWPSSDEPAPPPDSGDQAVVSPPPYEDGPASKTDVRSSDDDFPFGPPGRS